MPKIIDQVRSLQEITDWVLCGNYFITINGERLTIQQAFFIYHFHFED
jgi:hypothetical protein